MHVFIWQNHHPLLPLSTHCGVNINNQASLIILHSFYTASRWNIYHISPFLSSSLVCSTTVPHSVVQGTFIPLYSLHLTMFRLPRSWSGGALTHIILSKIAPLYPEVSLLRLYQAKPIIDSVLLRLSVHSLRPFLCYGPAIFALSACSVHLHQTCHWSIVLDFQLRLICMRALSPWLLDDLPQQLRLFSVPGHAKRSQSRNLSDTARKNHSSSRSPAFRKLIGKSFSLESDQSYDGRKLTKAPVYWPSLGLTQLICSKLAKESHSFISTRRFAFL